MTVGIDLRVLQVGHQFRGIGEVAKQTLNGMFELALKSGDHAFNFYVYDDEIDPLEFLIIPEGLNYSIVKIGRMPKPHDGRTTKQKLKNKWSVMFGNPIPGVSRKDDVFVQYDYSLGVPRKPRTLLIEHDLIPLIFWKDYFSSPWLHFKHKAARTTIRTAAHNYEYRRVLKRSLKRAKKIVCVSECTRQDVHKYMGIPLKKMTVIHNGADIKAANDKDVDREKLPTKPYLLFVGAGDARRKVEDLVAAFNNLKADGHDLQLVLAGENFPSPESIPNIVLRHDVMTSSYKDDILTVGYVNDATKQELYKNAVAFVFPTLYEGFGIPVLESMLLNCPVVTYKNSSIPEIGGNCILYARDWIGIKERVEQIIEMDSKAKTTFIGKAHKRAQGFTWDKTSKSLYDQL